MISKKFLCLNRNHFNHFLLFFFSEYISPFTVDSLQLSPLHISMTLLQNHIAKACSIYSCSHCLFIEYIVPFINCYPISIAMLFVKSLLRFKYHFNWANIQSFAKDMNVFTVRFKQHVFKLNLNCLRNYLAYIVLC